MKKINVFRWLLFPFAWLYGVVGWCRNKLYDWKVLKATGFEGVKLIGVGNLSSGGTGKTPHVEYLVNRYKEAYKVATLSRGYKRKTKGFVLATSKSTALEIGDEPMQMYRKFGKGGVLVAVCENRVEGVRKLLELQPNIEVILLDDVFQHRKIEVDTQILLTDFNYLFTEDFVLPMGSLREFRKGYERADVIVVTKCSPNLTDIDKQEIRKAIRPLTHQKSTFSFLEYGVPYSFFDAPHTVQHPPNPLQRGNRIVLDWREVDGVLVVCGIAKPERMVEYVSSRAGNVETLFFGDHHDFSIGDLEMIRERAGNRVVITTEKDAVRLELWRRELEEMGLAERIFVLGVEVDFGSFQTLSNPLGVGDVLAF